MLTFEFSLNILILGSIVIFASFTGYQWGCRRVRKMKMRIGELEQEMLNSDAEILELQKDYLLIESQLRDFQIPVIPIKTLVKDSPDEKEKYQEISLRKKLLGKENLLQHSVASK